jgi:hypothetical protein
METKEFKEWKEWFIRTEPEAACSFNDEDIYEIYLMNE